MFSKHTQNTATSKRLSVAPPYVRKPQRMTITVPWQLYQTLTKQSDLQGRSLSNLACFWLESHAAIVCGEDDQKG